MNKLVIKNKQKLTGAHYTPKLLAEFVAKQIIQAFVPHSKSSEIRLFDPGIGDGELLLSLIEELINQGYKNIEAHGFDTDHHALILASSRLHSGFPDLEINLQCQDFTDFVLDNFGMTGAGNLFNQGPPESFDLIIANPPYVRTQVMGAKTAQRLSRQFGLSGRVDLYFAFIVGIASVLKKGGIAGIIVSNRFLTTKSGMSIRKLLNEKFNILHIWDLGDTRLFDAAVLPAVILVKRKTSKASLSKSRFTSIYSTSFAHSENFGSNVIEALNFNGIVKVKNEVCYKVKHGFLEYENKPGGVWRISNDIADEWLNIVSSNTFYTFRDIGKIRVGVKTCADKVFIRSDWNQLPNDERPEEDLLKPVITHHVGQKFKSTQTGQARQILYPHIVVEGQRVAIDLNRYPYAAKYLNKHRDILESRHYVIEANRNWFEIWVPQDPRAWANDKIVFRDIAEEPTFWMDLSGSVVNGDCYWLTYESSEKKELLWLALAIANSSFIKEYYDHRFHNKLYAGRRRFITQYVEKFPLPNPKLEISRQIIKSAQKIYEILPSSKAENYMAELDKLVWKAFGLAVEEISG